jgi:Tfp pilus assembly protein PilF
MMLISKRYRYAVLLTIFSAAVTWGIRAEAEDSDAVQKAIALNKQALAAFANLDVQEAAKLLKEALELCETAQLEKHPMAARTHVHLGVVYVAGLKQRDQGMEEFKKALRLDPQIKITKAMVNPEVQSAFAEASMDVSEEVESAGSAPGAAKPELPAAQPAEPAQPAQPTASADSAIVHTPATEGAVGKPIPVRAQVPASLGGERVVLVYRPQGAADFLTREMDPVKDSDWYQTEIPPEATSGASVAYYILAQNGQGQPVAQNGTAAEPHVVDLGGAAASGGIIDGVNPDGATEAGAEGSEEGEGLSLWVALTGGTGFGYHSGTPEANRTDDQGRSLKSSGIAMSQLLQISPEVGYFLSDNLLLSVQGRFQLVTGASKVKFSDAEKNKTACNGGTCQPSHYALAGLAKVTWFLGQPGRVMPFLSLAAGAGQIRQVVGVGKLEGCSSTCKDTVVGGLVLFGPGAGITIELSTHFSLVAGVNVLVGVPKVMANADANFGIAYLR